MDVLKWMGSWIEKFFKHCVTAETKFWIISGEEELRKHEGISTGSSFS